MAKATEVLKRILSRKADKGRILAGITGNFAGQVATGKSNTIWVRTGGAAMTVYNDLVPALPNIGVYIEETEPGNRQWRVSGTRATVDGEEAAGTQLHHLSHEWMATGAGNDVVYVHLRQLLPLRVGPIGGMVVNIYPGTVMVGGVATVIEPGTSGYDLSGHVPTTSGKARWVLVCISAAGSVTFVDGIEVDVAALASTAVPTGPSGCVRLAAVRLYTGQTEIMEARVAAMNDIWDLRLATFLESHHSTHESGGSDELDVSGLHGVLADPQQVTYMERDDLSSLCNGSRIEFYTTLEFVGGELRVFLNGLLQTPGSGNDYIESGTCDYFIMAAAPRTGDRLEAFYYQAYPQTVTGPYSPSYGALATVVRMNTHGHTTESDGNNSPATYVSLYSALGYGALAITDHDLVTTQPVGITAPVAGDEQTTDNGHITSLNCSYLRGSETGLQAIVNGIVAAGGIAIINHPNWTWITITYSTLAAMTGYTGIEIFNAQSSEEGKSMAIELWDAILTNVRKDVWGIASDDFHASSYIYRPGAGYLQLFVASNTVENVVDAISKGNFVANVNNDGVTPGYPTINSLGISITCEGATSIRFISQAGLRQEDTGETGNYQFDGDDEYIRIEAVGDYADDFSSFDTTQGYGTNGGSWAASAGVLTQGNATTDLAFAVLKRYVPADLEAQVDTRFDDASATSAQSCLCINFQEVTDFLAFRLAGSNNSDANTFGIFYCESSTNSALKDQVAFTPASGTWYTMKVRYVYATGTLYGKIWERGTTEPTDWQLEYSGVNGKVNGKVALRCRQKVSYDNLYVKGFKSYYQPIPVGDWS